MSTPSETPAPRSRRPRRYVCLAILAILALGLWRTDARWLPPVRSRVVGLARREGVLPPAAITRRVSSSSPSWRPGSWTEKARPYFGVPVPYPVWLSAKHSGAGYAGIAQSGPWMPGVPLRFPWRAYTLGESGGDGRSPVPGFALNAGFYYEIFVEPATLNMALAEVVNGCPALAWDHPGRVPSGCALQPFIQDGQVYWQVGSPPWIFFTVHDGWMVALSFADTGVTTAVQQRLAARMFAAYAAQPGWHWPPSIPRGTP